MIQSTVVVPEKTFFSCRLLYSWRSCPLVVYLFFSQKEWQSPFFEVYCVVFICCTTCCHSLSFVVTRCHSLSLVVPLFVIRCHSLSFVVSLVCTCCHSLICLFINDQKFLGITNDSNFTFEKYIN